MAYHRCQNSKSKIKAIFVHCTCILLDLCRKSEGSPFSRNFEWSVLSLFFLQCRRFKCPRNHSNQTKCIFGKRIKSVLAGVFCDVFLQNNFNLGQDISSNCFLASRRCRTQFPAVICSSLIFNKCSSTFKMKTLSFQQISVTLRVIIDGH